MSIPPTAPRRWSSPGAWVAALFVAAHVALAVTVVRQPLDVAAHPGERAKIAPLFHNMLYCLGPGADFFAVYHAGVKAQRHEDPYDGGEIPQRTPYWYHYRYLPGLGASLGRALARLVPRAAYVLWTTLTELVMAGVAFSLWRLARRQSVEAGEGAPAPGSPRWLAPVAVVLQAASTPLLLELHMGQLTAFTLGLALIAVLAVDQPSLFSARPLVSQGARRSRTARAVSTVAAFLYAAAVEVKVFPLVLGPALLRRKAGRWALFASAVLVALVEGPLLWGKPSLYRTFWALNFDSGLGGMGTGNFGLSYVLFLLGKARGIVWNDGSFGRLTLGLKVVFLGLATVAALGRRRQLIVAAATLVFAHILSYPYVWEHHLSGVLPFGVALLIVRTTRAPVAGAIERAVILSALLMLALPTTFYFQDPWHDVGRDPAATWGLAAHLTPPLCKVIPTFALFVVGVRDAWLRWRQRA